MKVVWSDDAVWALVVLETRLVQRYSPDQAARIVEELVRRVDHLEDHPQLGRIVVPTRMPLDERDGGDE
jgi:plasmid stabilization system protein ParE